MNYRPTRPTSLRWSVTIVTMWGDEGPKRTHTFTVSASSDASARFRALERAREIGLAFVTLSDIGEVTPQR